MRGTMTLRRIAVVLISIISMNTIGCTKPAKITTPIEQIKFDEEYRYSIKLKDNKWVHGVEGAKLSSTATELNYELGSQKSTLLNQNISQINGIKKKDASTGMVAGIGIGVLGVVAGSVFAALTKPDRPTFYGQQQEEPNYFVPLVVGMLAGAVIGGIVQSAITNRSAVEITPIAIPISEVNTSTETVIP